MTGTMFRDLLAEAVARSFYAMSGGDPGAFTGDPALDPFPGDHQVAFDILRTPVPWVDCPTCDALGWIGGPTPDDTDPADTCPACSGTGTPSIAQLLAWGQAVAQDPGRRFDGETVEDYRNWVLGVQP